MNPWRTPIPGGADAGRHRYGEAPIRGGTVRRRILTVTAAAVLAVTVVVVGAAGASAGTTTTEGFGAPAVARDDNPTVCAAAAKTVSDGFDKFVADMKTVSNLARKGDLVG